MTRLRLVHLIVQPVVVADDGEHLSFVQVGQMTVPAADLDGFPASFREQLAEQEARMAGEAGALALAREAVDVAAEASASRDTTARLAEEVGELARGAARLPIE